METEKQVEPKNKRVREIDKQEQELLKFLKDKGLVKEENGKFIVDISKANKEYFREAWKNYWKTDSVSFEEFFKLYRNYRPRGSLVEAKEFGRLLYGKTIYTERYRRIGGEGEVPIYLDPVSTGEPSVKVGTGIKHTRMGEKTFDVEAGMAYNPEEEESKKTKPYVKVSKGGAFAQFLNGVKEIQVGVSEGIFTLMAEIKKGVDYFFAVALGPWIGKIDLQTGKPGGTFAWIVPAFETGKGILTRMFGDDTVMYAHGNAKIEKGNTIKGMNARLEELQLKISEITKAEEKQIRFKDEKGKEYVAEFDEQMNAWRVDERVGVLKRIWRALNPVNLVKDVVKAVVINPIKSLVDNYYRFKAPSENEKLGGEEKKKCWEKMWDEFDLGNLHTARYNALLLVQNSEGTERAKNTVILDKIEWAMGHRGFFLGYIRGMGLGNKKNMVNQSIEKRVKESIDILRKEEPQSAKFRYAYEYLRAKSEFVYARDGGLTPASPSPEYLKNDIMNGLFEAEERLPKLKIGGRLQVERVDFTKVKINKNNPDYRQHEMLLAFLQRAYDEIPAYRAELERWFTSFAFDSKPGETLDAFYRGFVKKNIGNPEFLVKTNELTKEELKQIYEKGVGKKFSPKPQS